MDSNNFDAGYHFAIVKRVKVVSAPSPVATTGSLKVIIRRGLTWSFCNIVLARFMAVRDTVTLLRRWKLAGNVIGAA